MLCVRERVKHVEYEKGMRADGSEQMRSNVVRIQICENPNM